MHVSTGPRQPLGRDRDGEGREQESGQPASSRPEPRVGRTHLCCSRHYTLDAALPLRLRPESMERPRCLRACVIRSLYHMYEPFAARISRSPAIPESTPSTLKNSKVSRWQSWGLSRGPP